MEQKQNEDGTWSDAIPIKMSWPNRLWVWWHRRHI